VGAAIYSPLANGVLTDNTLEGSGPHPLARGPRNPDAADTFAQQARAFGFLSEVGGNSLAQAATRFVLGLPGVTVALGGFSDRAQVIEAAACSGQGPLSEEQMMRIEMAWRANPGLAR